MYTNDAARRLRDEMKKQGVSTTTLAAVLDISTSRMSQIRHGAPMTQYQLSEACAYLDISPTWLVFGKGPTRLSAVN